ncbi:MAG: sigma-70 family RNA polymerase sigma factor, partial [Phycisphaerae bacterium]|nr:sigma-70 family RNA polymerase sigma factor [Phycisphaerae bacterium]
NETLLRLLRDGALATMGNRAYLFGAAACAMRRMLVDHARQHAAAKRGGRARRHALDDTLVEFDRDTIDVLALGEALEELTRMGPRQAEVVTLRFFGGLSAEEIAVQLGISSRTVADDLRIARAWLRVRLSGEQHHDG